METMALAEEYDPYAGMPDAAQRKDFARAEHRLNSALCAVHHCDDIKDRELTAHALETLATICDDLRACARTLANKQICLLQEEVAKPKAEW